MRLFLAVWPPADIVASLAALPRPETAELRWTTPDQWHVTLRFLGEVGPDAAAEVSRLVAGGLGSVGPVEAHLGPSTARFGRRVLHVPVSGLDALAAATVAATAGIGRSPDHRPFAGHVTLARARHPRGVELRPLAGAPVAGHWVVSEIAVEASRLGAGPGRSARYEVLDVLALGAAPGA